MLAVRGAARRFGGVTAVAGVDLDVAQGALVSIIGPNGAGKTTLFNLIAGQDRPDAGTVALDGQDATGATPERMARLGLARTFQHGRVFANLTVMDNVLVGAHTRLPGSRRPVLVELFSALVGRGRRVDEGLREEARQVLARFGDRLLPRLDHPAYSLSYANRRRVEIARALMLRPRVLLLDEPTAGMNQTETAEMLAIVRELKAGGLTILLIEHKLDMVMQLSDRVVVLDDGHKIADGAPQAVRRDKRVIEAYLGASTLGRQAA